MQPYAAAMFSAWQVHGRVTQPDDIFLRTRSNVGEIQPSTLNKERHVDVDPGQPSVLVRAAPDDLWSAAEQRFSQLVLHSQLHCNVGRQMC